MKQLLQNLRTGETFVAEVPIPMPKPGTALVRTAVSLVSAGTERMLVEFAEKSLLGKARSRPDLARQVIDKSRREGLFTTLESAFNRLDQPIPLGYSSSGTIVSLGEGIEGYHVGQRVACAGGGYAVHAEFAVVPRNLLAALPAEVDFESAAFTTLGAIALHGFRLAAPAIGERLAVIGLGLLGLLTVSIAKAAGCHVLGIDLDPNRVHLAQRMGATESVVRQDAEAAAQSFSQAGGCDAVLICADTPSSDPVELAGLISRDRGCVVAVGAVGLNLPRKVYYEKEINFINSRSYGPGRYDPTYEEGGHDYPVGYVRWTEGRNLEAFVDLLATHRVVVQPLITHRFPIEQAPTAYELITGKQKEPYLGVLLTYPFRQTDNLAEASSPIFTDRVESSPSAPVDKVSLGVLGAGNFAAAVLLPAISKFPDLELVGIASASGLSAQHAAKRYRFRYACTDENQILADPSITTVAILTRHHLHARQVIAALKHGKHVFCEKPLAIYPQELDEIIHIFGDNGKGSSEFASLKNNPSPLSPNPYPLLTVGFNRRFAPLSRLLKDFVDSRKEPLVAHYRVNAGYLPLTHWLHDPDQGGGRIIGEACHFIDYLTFLIGELPATVVAQGLPDNGRYRQDNVAMIFTFPDGSIGTIAYLANGDRSFPKERLELFTMGRVAILDDYRSLEMIANGRREVLRSHWRQDKGHRSVWKAFISAIRNGSPPPIPYQHLFGVTRATFSAMQALRTQEKVRI